ncbi:MAG: hypothetical protein KAJ14_06400 [Candidatus Omnitrophica bacterium]|nr:hypothetical protein [Candidatus Omnitrophota bacterium]MCK5289205.1 hypothetical protein [Candidatus Omnitrophota bacterium]MCK5394230.1 hypothetical protein [Candidatus Omnitrophota bacterium]MCK5492720.1 hypothetical protein [Candidatus Omnitrophota bacterium]
MKEFLIGLIFLIAVLLFAGIGLLLMPLLLVLAFFLRIIVVFALIIFTIWFLGKMIIVVWGKINK